LVTSGLGLIKRHDFSSVFSGLASACWRRERGFS
jgi:hypothetical protein